MADAATGIADLSLPASGTASGTGAADTANAGATGSAGGTGTPAPFDWSKAGLDDVSLSTVNTKGWKSPADVIGSYRNLETAVGVPPERLIKLPKDASDPKAWNDIYTKLGRPETAEKYVLPVPEGDKGEFATAVKPWMHEAGLSQSQATKLATKWNEHIASTQKAEQAAIEAAHTKDVADLKTQWGADYDARAALVDRAAEKFGMTQEQLDAFKIVLGPKQAMEFLHNIGSKIAVEDTSVPGMSGQSAGFGMTPEAAQARIAQLKTDKDFAQLFSSKDAKQRSEARNEMTRLHQLAYPGETPIAFSTSTRK